MDKGILVLGIIFLFIVSSLTPMVIGYDDEPTELDKHLANLAYICKEPDGFNNVKYECYKQQLMKQSSSDDSDNDVVVKPENTIVQIESKAAPLSFGPMDSAWPMFGHDPRHTGRSPYSTAENYGDLKWAFKTDWFIETSPAIDNNGTIYFADWSDFLYAVYPNGTMKWNYSYGDGTTSSSPAIGEDGTIYFGADNGYLYAINENGTTKWAFAQGQSIFGAPTISEEGTIYFSTFDENGKFYAINPNGTEKWHYDADFYCQQSPAIADDGTIYFNSHIYLYAFYPNGTLKWKLKLGDPNFTFLGGPSVGDDGTIYIPCDTGYLYAINPNGTIKWQSSIEWGSWAAPSIGVDGTIYIGYKHMFAFYPNGTLKWVFIPDGNEWHSIDSKTYAISADGTIFIGTKKDGQNCYIIALNPNGTEKWRKWISNERALSSPAIAEDGTVYIGVEMNPDEEKRGFLYAFGLKDLEADADGPYYGLINEPLQFIGSSSGGYYPHSYHWDFGDDQYSDEQNPIHIYTSVGNYTVTLTVTDNKSNTSSDITWTKIKESNNPPNKPSISGPTRGKVGTPYDYNFVTTDTDNDEWLYYKIDWGDSSKSGWIGPYFPGQDVTLSHTWNQQGTYIIKAKAKDNYGSESDWGTLSVTMPLNLQSSQQSSNQLLLKIMQRLLLQQ